MLPRAKEVLSEAGVDEEPLLEGSGLPVGLGQTAASRVPLANAWPCQTQTTRHDETCVISVKTLTGL